MRMTLSNDASLAAAHCPLVTHPRFELKGSGVLCDEKGQLKWQGGADEATYL
jgi:hypothetical protein